MSYTRQVHQIYQIGDSLSWNGTVENKLKTLLGDDWNVVNFGIPQNTTSLMSSRFNSEILGNRDIEYVIIWGGIVDVINGVSASTIETNLQDMYTAAHNVGLKVIAVNISPNNGLVSGKQAVLDTVNSWIMNTAINIDYKIDVYSVLEDPNNLDNLLSTYNSGDGLHLSTAGYEIVGTTIYNNTTWTMSEKGNASDFIRGDGWRTINETITYVSIDDPTGVIDIAGDQRARFNEGMKIKFQSLSNNIKGIITNVNQTLQSGKTRITFLHEIDPSDNQAINLMVNDAIIRPFYSCEKAPVGFPMDKRKWSIRIVDTTDRSQVNPVYTTVYNLGSQQISIPIGAWSLSARVQLGAIPASVQSVIEAFVGLSTSNNSFSDHSTKARVMLNYGNQIGESVDLHRDIVLTSKTIYYIVTMMTYGSGQGATLANWNGTQNLVMLTICNYL